MPSHYDDKHGGKSKVNKGAKPKKRKKPEHSKTKKARAEDTERSLREWRRLKEDTDGYAPERMRKDKGRKIAIQSARSQNRRERTDDYYDGPDDAAARKDSRRYNRIRAEELAALRAGRLSYRKRRKIED
tara:strand:+ start:255 stop:644 length:390 start_codon:yes stop_codon:yes gene_type:complete